MKTTHSAKSEDCKDLNWSAAEKSKLFLFKHLGTTTLGGHPSGNFGRGSPNPTHPLCEEIDFKRFVRTHPPTNQSIHPSVFLAMTMLSFK